jgi:glycosyltransferase involved in cell wall biosynthesis
MTMVSVCMATKNGSRYIREQIDSILLQLTENDELIISDDCSSDETVQLIESYHDNRIKLHCNNIEKGIARNFETSLMLSKGQYIFLADQDDIWQAGKINTMVSYLNQYDLVICDCAIGDNTVPSSHKSFFILNNSGKGFVKNIIKNSYMGCCMAFTRSLLQKALPFPSDIPIHDSWIGLIGELYYKVHFIPEVLVYHRRHTDNASSTGRTSRLSLYKKLLNRYNVLKNLLFHRAYAR